VPFPVPVVLAFPRQYKQNARFCGRMLGIDFAFVSLLSIRKGHYDDVASIQGRNFVPDEY
jgi:hypothetical protein